MMLTCESPPACLPAMAPQRAVAARPRLRRVLVIEDSEIHFEVLNLRLRAEYPSLEAVLCLGDTLDLLEKISAFGPELVITDYHMPGYDVLATVTALRQRWPRLPLLVMSGQVGEERAVQLLKAGASDFLPKARLERLALVIDRELAEVQAQTALDLFSEVQLQERLRQAEARLRHLSLHQSESHELQMANLSRELHDNLGQVLALLKLHLSAAAQPDLPSARRALEIDQALPLVDMALGRLREVCGDLWPSELRDFGLGPALAGVCRAAARAGGIAVTCNETGQPRALASSSLLGLFRVGQQALTNALRHAGAASVRLELDWQDAAVTLTVSDDGRGFDASAPCLPSQHGLRGMRERMELLGGRLCIDSRPGHGSSVQARLPARAGEGA